MVISGRLRAEICWETLIGAHVASSRKGFDEMPVYIKKSPTASMTPYTCRRFPVEFFFRFWVFSFQYFGLFVLASGRVGEALLGAFEAKQSSCHASDKPYQNIKRLKPSDGGLSTDVWVSAAVLTPTTHGSSFAWSLKRTRKMDPDLQRHRQT